MDRINGVLIYLKFRAKNLAEDFFFNEEGDVNIVSIIVLIGIVIIVALVFRKRITSLVNSLFDSIDESASDAITN
ncbi:MAG: flagellin-like protein [Clostridiales bacterium]|nr:flagellin-like protein [Clostridiales bacterium]